MNVVYFRCYLTLLFVVFASSTGAATIPLTISMTSVSDLGNTNIPRPPINLAPNTLVLQTQKGPGLSPTIFDELRITGLAPDSVDRMLNYKNGDPPSYQWIITAANAASFGVDWLAFQSHLNETKFQDVSTNIRFAYAPSPPSGNPTAGGFASVATALQNAGAPNFVWATGFQLHEVKITIDYYFWHDILEGLRGVKIRADISADANVVPEPATMLLFSVSIGFLPAMIARRKRAINGGKFLCCRPAVCRVNARR